MTNEELKKKICDIIAPYVSAYGEDEAIADALISAGIGDVTEWKERAEKEKTEKNKRKCTANDWKQRFESREKQLAELRTTSCEAVIRKDRVISEQKSEIDRLSTEHDEYKHRAEVAERALATVCEEVLHARYPVESVTVSVVDDFIQHTLKEAEKEISEEKEE